VGPASILFVERTFMSRIPNSAIPHAVAEPEAEASRGAFLIDGARGLADKAKANPKTSAAIGAGVIAATAGAVALARRGRAGANGKAKKSKKD
ncbi:MAG: hypothetical protein ACT4N8_12685, partial [Sphingosinicella sp.]|uniref:hypothetical protein n=1 Tax=Sphingosinicella sp. TaxID=1917971 RepID=UPI0040379BF3